MTKRLERIRRLEEIGLATWPALHERHLGEWVLRSAAEVTSRSNSVSPLGPPIGSLQGAIHDVEQWYAASRVPSRFRLTELAPSELETILDARGYRREPAVAVMTSLVENTCEIGNVRIDDAPSPPWFDALMVRRFPPGTNPEIVQAMLANLSTSTGYAGLEAAGELAAMGMGVVWGQAVAVYVMHTAPHLCGLGLGTQVLQALQAWGRNNGASLAFLQVRTENAPARVFYSRHGFRTEYQYWYRAFDPRAG